MPPDIPLIASIPTRRLELVPLREEHAVEMVDVLANPELYRFIGGEPPTIEELRERYRRQLRGSPRPSEIWWNWVLCLRPENFLVGTIQATVAWERSHQRHHAEVAWLVGADWQGRGYAQEAARGLADWLPGHGVGEIHAHIHPEHHASAAIARCLGMVRTGEWQDEEQRWRLDRTGRKTAGIQT